MRYRDLAAVRWTISFRGINLKVFGTRFVCVGSRASA
jgi:hypothetical protein